VNCTIDRLRVKDTFSRVATTLHTQLIRRTGGRLGGQMFKRPMILLTTTGRISGQPRVTPLLCHPDGDRYLLIGSNGGDDRDPQWVRNLQANPDATIELDGETIPVRATIATPEEKKVLWLKATATYKGYDNYQRRTSRDIPVVILTRRS
jgi:deazaflavin-dependent oxidoreductase (nitroreductase family)